MTNKATQFSSTNQPKKNGRPKGTMDLKAIIKIFFEQDIELEDIEGRPKKMRVIDAMVMKQIKRACKDGDLASYKEMADRYFGKVKDEVKHSGDVIINYGHRKKANDE